MCRALHEETLMQDTREDTRKDGNLRGRGKAGGGHEHSSTRERPSTARSAIQERDVARGVVLTLVVLSVGDGYYNHQLYISKLSVALVWAVFGHL